MYKRMIPAMIGLLSITAIVGCGGSGDAGSDGPRIEKLRAYVAELSGAQLKDVAWDAASGSFTIEGDVRMRLADAEARYAAGAKPGTLQRSYQYLVTQTNIRDVRICTDGTVPTAWGDIMDTAIANWNASGSAVHMVRVSCSQTYDIITNSYYDSATSTIAYAYLPGGDGNVGFGVSINTYYDTLSLSQKVFALTHELGHSIGLMHTDQTSGNLIPGTSDNDPYSVMNSFVRSWSAFTSGDLVAVRYLYPETSSPEPSPTPTATPTSTPGDTVAPSVSLTSPANGATVARRASISITASASDDVGVARVEFRVNGSLACTDSTASYSCSWKVPSSPRKSYVLEARAFDAAGNSSASSVTVRSN